MAELPRHVAPGGVGRMVIGFACGLVAGAIVAMVLPRDDGPRRRWPSLDPVLDTAPAAVIDPDVEPDAEPGEQRRR